MLNTDFYAGLAVARGILVGLDVEDSTRLTKSSPLKLAQKRFASREFDVLKGTYFLPYLQTSESLKFVSISNRTCFDVASIV